MRLRPAVLLAAAAWVVAGCGGAWDCDAVERDLAEHRQLVLPLLEDLTLGSSGVSNCDSGAAGYTSVALKRDVTVEDVTARLKGHGWSEMTDAPGAVTLATSTDRGKVEARLFRRPPAAGVGDDEVVLEVVTDRG